MLSQTVQDAMNEQIKHELYSAYLYLAMSAYCQANNLPGIGAMDSAAKQGRSWARDEILRVYQRSGWASVAPGD